jgi:hypothetical protein
MDKKQLHHLWTRIRPIRPQYFLAAFALSGVVCIAALRHNNQTMVKLRNDVYVADQNNGNVQAALEKLQTYVVSHMNTGLSTGTNVYPPIQLKYTYDRLEQSAIQATQTNTQIYTNAQHYCEGQDSTDFSGHNRVPCIESYVTTHGGTKAAAIPTALYEFDFVATKWSPDLAGWSLVLSVLFLVLFVATAILDRWFKNRVD